MAERDRQRHWPLHRHRDGYLRPCYYHGRRHPALHRPDEHQGLDPLESTSPTMAASPMSAQAARSAGAKTPPALRRPRPPHRRGERPRHLLLGAGRAADPTNLRCLLRRWLPLLPR